MSKADLNEALALYPQAQAILKRRAQSVMRKNEVRERDRVKRQISKKPVQRKHAKSNAHDTSEEMELEKPLAESHSTEQSLSMRTTNNVRRNAGDFGNKLDNGSCSLTSNIAITKQTAPASRAQSIGRSRICDFIVDCAESNQPENLGSSKEHIELHNL